MNSLPATVHILQSSIINKRIEFDNQVSLSWNANGANLLSSSLSRVAFSCRYTSRFDVSVSVNIELKHTHTHKHNNCITLYSKRLEHLTFQKFGIN